MITVRLKKFFALAMCAMFFAFSVSAQEDEGEERKGGFRKENFFTGGSISLSFFNNSFLVGGSPVFGYSLTRWADIGLVGNYNYTSYRDYYDLNDKLRQSIYGGGVFTRLFPARFLFAQAQIEHNWIKLRYIPAPNTGNVTQTERLSGNSVLIGAGYTTGREPQGGSAYGFLSILFDVGNSENSPYKDGQGRAIPIIRAGFNVPLFQGRR